jgi:ABC-type multidrug transport system ATPase subunit
VILRANEIRKRFETRWVLRDASLALESGECVLLQGANGSGKTTLAQILATLLAPDRGTIEIDGFAPEKNRRTARRSIGFASHRPLLYPGLTPLENLDFFGRLAGLSDAKPRAAAFLDRFGLSAFAGKTMEHFSRGMLQRVALTRALLPEPRLLILDEPYAGLDDEGSATLNALLGEAKRRGAAILLIAHERERASGLITRHCLLRDGAVEPSP